MANLKLDFSELCVLCKYRHTTGNPDKTTPQCRLLEDHHEYYTDCAEWRCPREKEQE